MAGRRLAGVVVAVALVALPGCGSSSSSDADDAKAAMKDFLAALAKGDGKKACSLADEAGRKRLVAAGRGRATCEDVIKLIATRLPPNVKEGLENAEIKKVTVKGNTATIKDSDIKSSKGDASAFLRGGRPTKLVKEGGSWKLSGTGG